MAQEHGMPELSQEYDTSESFQEEAVYRRYAPQVFAYLLRNTPSHQDAEDLLLEVFQIVLEKLPTLEDTPRLGAYLQVVARNKMADYYRRRGQQQLIPLEDIAETVYEREELGPEQILLAQEQSANLRRVVNSLPELQQTILRLRFGHALRCREIAQKINKSENAVRMMLSRSLKHLRSLHSMYEER